MFPLCPLASKWCFAQLPRAFIVTVMSQNFQSHVSRLSNIRLPGRTIIKDSRYSSNIVLFRLIPFKGFGQCLNHEMSADRLLRTSLLKFNKVSLKIGYSEQRQISIDISTRHLKQQILQYLRQLQQQLLTVSR